MTARLLLAAALLVLLLGPGCALAQACRPEVDAAEVGAQVAAIADIPEADRGNLALMSRQGFGGQRVTIDRGVVRGANIGQLSGAEVPELAGRTVHGWAYLAGADAVVVIDCQPGQPARPAKRRVLRAKNLDAPRPPVAAASAAPRATFGQGRASLRAQVQPPAAGSGLSFFGLQLAMPVPEPEGLGLGAVLAALVISRGLRRQRSL